PDVPPGMLFTSSRGEVPLSRTATRSSKKRSASFARSWGLSAARCKNCLRWGSFMLNLPFTSFDHFVGAGEQRWRDDEAKRVLAPGYKDKPQGANLPAVLCAPRDKGHCKISSAPCFEVKRDNAHGVLGQI